MPRMQAAQWRARDVSRKTALSQIQSAIVTSQWDKWKRPGMSGDVATWWMWVSMISWELTAAWMNSIPKDPLNNDVTWLWSNGKMWTWMSGDYGYIVTTRHWTPAWWFVLMAKTEVEWWSNRVYCGNTLGSWNITWGTDIWSINICQTVTKPSGTTTWCKSNATDCTYSSDDQLRYIVIY